MAYDINMENIEIYNETRDMLPSISSTMLQVRCSEHASSKSVQSSPIWGYRPRFPRKVAANISQFTSFQNWNYSEDGFWSLCIKLAGNEQTGRHTAPIMTPPVKSITRQHSTQCVGNMPPPSPRHLLPHVLQIMPRNPKYDQFQPKGPIMRKIHRARPKCLETPNFTRFTKSK